MALNILYQKRENPLIIETGCQRMADDLGAGMSTSIFGEYLKRYGGRLFTVDISQHNLDICKGCTIDFADYIKYVCQDSISFLRHNEEKADLLYLDSLDYPIGDEAGDIQKQVAAQVHCLKEFKAAVKGGTVTNSTIILIDDNQLPGGGKPRLLKQHLQDEGYLCLLDLQQSLWVKGI